jgi:hypothetical protein
MLGPLPSRREVAGSSTQPVHRGPEAEPRAGSGLQRGVRHKQIKSLICHNNFCLKFHSFGIAEPWGNKHEGTRRQNDMNRTVGQLLVHPDVGFSTIGEVRRKYGDQRMIFIDLRGASGL